MDCFGTCVDVFADEANCGRCALACLAGEECVDGLCGIECR